MHKKRVTIQRKPLDYSRFHTQQSNAACRALCQSQAFLVPTLSVGRGANWTLT